MTELLDFYKQQVEHASGFHPWLDKLRREALHDFGRVGFPSNKIEDWKYTKVSEFANQHFATSTVDLDLPSGFADDGVIVMSLFDAVEKYPELVQVYLSKLSKHNNGFSALNTALMQQGVFVFIPKETVLKEPIRIGIKNTQKGEARYLRNLVILERGADATLVEQFEGDEQGYFTNTITEAFIGDNAKLTHLKIQNEAQNAFHIGCVNATLGRDSQFYSHSYSFGGKLVRSDTNVEFESTGAECEFNGLYLVDEGQHIDHHTIANHKVAHCKSNEFYKGILNGKSRAVFNGKVIVAKDAQKTDASQKNNNLLLSKNAEVDTKPELEIYADDVKCAHGATVGQLDGNALFYLNSRGLSQAQAREFLIQAFAHDVISLCPLADEKQSVQSLLDSKLGVRCL
jgi:Fe-S cluster assembly protein SufD